MKAEAASTATSLDELISRAATRLSRVSDTPLLDCQLIMSHVLRRSRSWLFAHGDEVPDRNQVSTFHTHLERRTEGEPVAYITGRKSFWTMDLHVDPRVLVPRPETERLIEAVLSRLDSEPRSVLDPGTGSGAIAIALAIERPTWRIHATDASEAALAVASRNVAEWVPGRVALTHGNWMDAIAPASLDVIVCNPPYVRDGDPHLRRLRHEPRGALVSGGDGLDDIRIVVEQASSCLMPGGWLFLEHGYDQQGAVAQLLGAHGFGHIERLADIGRQPRYVIARRPL